MQWSYRILPLVNVFEGGEIMGTRPRHKDRVAITVVIMVKYTLTNKLKLGTAQELRCKKTAYRDEH